MKRLLLILCLLGSISGLLAQSLSQYEYFFDTDPGVGNGTPFVLPATTDTLNATDTIPIGNLSPGFHTFNLRVKDNNQVWSHYKSQVLYVEATHPDSVPQILAWEYFVDEDPSSGNGVSNSFSPTNQTDITTTLSFPNLNPGFHQLGVRVKDQAGSWGQVSYRNFYLQDTASLNPKPLLSYELFTDSVGDPGSGAWGFTLGPGDTMNWNIGLVLPFAGIQLDPGFHQLAIRWDNTVGHQSHYVQRLIHIEDSADLRPPARLALMEYFFDTDPGQGNGTLVPFSPLVDTLDATYTVATTGLSLGSHQIGVRVRDSLGIWSLTQVDSFSVGTCGTFVPPVTVSGPLVLCDGDSTTLSTLATYASYLWSTGDTTATITVSQPGTYSVSVTDGLGCPGTSDSVVIQASNASRPEILALGPLSFCEGDHVLLTTTQPFSGLNWSTGSTADTILVVETGVYSVSYTDNLGCSLSSEPVSVMVNSAGPDPVITALLNDKLWLSPSGIETRWYVDGNLLSIDNDTITAPQSGIYQAQYRGAFECWSSLSEPLEYWLTDVTEKIPASGLRLYPNPNAGQFQLMVQEKVWNQLSLQIYNSRGYPV